MCSSLCTFLHGLLSLLKFWREGSRRLLSVIHSVATYFTNSRYGAKKAAAYFCDRRDLRDCLAQFIYAPW